MKSLVRHIYEKLIINKDYKSLSDDFCDEFGMDLNSITHECCTEYERGKNKVHYSHGNIYTISFEIRR